MLVDEAVEVGVLVEFRVARGAKHAPLLDPRVQTIASRLAAGQTS